MRGNMCCFLSEIVWPHLILYILSTNFSLKILASFFRAECYLSITHMYIYHNFIFQYFYLLMNSDIESILCYGK